LTVLSDHPAPCPCLAASAGPQTAWHRPTDCECHPPAATPLPPSQSFARLLYTDLPSPAAKWLQAPALHSPLAAPPNASFRQRTTGPPPASLQRTRCRPSPPS